MIQYELYLNDEVALRDVFQLCRGRYLRQNLLRPPLHLRGSHLSSLDLSRHYFVDRERDPLHTCLKTLRGGLHGGHLIACLSGNLSNTVAHEAKPHHSYSPNRMNPTGYVSRLKEHPSRAVQSSSS